MYFHSSKDWTYFLTADLADDSRANRASWLTEASLAFDLADAFISRQLPIAVRILGVIFVQKSIIGDDIDRTLFISPDAHLP